MRVFVSFCLLLLAQATFAQRGGRPWGAEQACGTPDTPRLGDYSSAWAPRLPDGGPEWLQLDFGREVEMSELIIHESCNPGAITRVVALAGNGNEATLWVGTAPRPSASAAEPHRFSMKPEGRRILVRSVRVELDTRLIPGWEEIDAVQLVGRDGSRQWAGQAMASSSYGDLVLPSLAAMRASWSPAQATGAPDTPSMGDFPTAWASQDPNGGYEWLLLDYTNIVEISQINIYENLGPGAVSRIIALPENGAEVVLWEGVEPVAAMANSQVVVSSIEATRPARAKRIRVELDTLRVPGWNEIDAVELVGSDGSRQWASGASASSSYGAPVVALTQPAPAVQQSVRSLTERVAELERRLAQAEALVAKSPSNARRAKDNNPRPWFPEQACGRPDTRQMGDFPTAWASRDCDSGREWLELAYPRAVEIAQLRIYETYNPGAITGIVAITQTGDVTLWAGVAPRPNPASREPHVFSIAPDTRVHAAAIRIYLDSSLVAGWNEIDAVELVGSDGSTQWAGEASASSSFGDQHLSLGAARFGRMPPAVSDGAQLIEVLDRHMGDLEARLQKFAAPPPPARLPRPADPTTPRRRDSVNPWNWGPEQACGSPDTARLGDFVTAWAPRVMDGGKEWLEVAFERDVEIDEVRVFESCGPGAITGVAALTPSGAVPLQTRTSSAHAMLSPCNLSVHVSTPLDPGTRARKVRIELDTTLVPGWNEIDAVELIGRDGSRHWAIEAAASSSYADQSQ